MYAVIKTGGKQYKVVAGEKLKVEQIPADIGSELSIDQVLAVGAGESIKFRSEEHTSDSSHIQKSRMPSSA